MLVGESEGISSNLYRNLHACILGVPCMYMGGAIAPSLAPDFQAFGFGGTAELPSCGRETRFWKGGFLMAP